MWCIRDSAYCTTFGHMLKGVDLNFDDDDDGLIIKILFYRKRELLVIKQILWFPRKKNKNSKWNTIEEREIPQSSCAIPSWNRHPSEYPLFRINPIQESSLSDNGSFSNGYPAVCCPLHPECFVVVAIHYVRSVDLYFFLTRGEVAEEAVCVTIPAYDDFVKSASARCWIFRRVRRERHDMLVLGRRASLGWLSTWITGCSCVCLRWISGPKKLR